MSIEFIGREQELDRIRSAITSSGRQILCIEGEGGLGKTRLLVQVAKEFESVENLHIGEIIDFDDPRFHLADNIGQEIAGQLGEDLFQSYLQELQHRRFLERHKASPEYLARQSRIIENEFLQAYQQAASERRVTLRFDTTDNLRGTSASVEYIAWLAKHAPNTCVLVAGRDSTKVLDVMRVQKSERAKMILDLAPLSEDDCRAYLYQKLKQKIMPLTPELADKLVLLSRGRIVLLDIAVEWLWHEGIPPKWLQELQVEQIVEGESEGVEVYERFEDRLFDHVRAVRNNLDRLVLLLSRVYPLDQTAVGTLLRLSEQEAELWMGKARVLTFVKQIPGGYIKLHDEVEEIINKHVWQRIPSKRASYYRESAVRYLEARCADLLRDVQGRSLQSEYTLYTFLTQQMRHLLHLDVQKGYEVFQRNWHAAEDDFQSPGFQRMLLDEMIPFQETIQPEQRWEIMLSQANCLIREGKYDEAIDEYLELLLEQLLPEQDLRRVRALIARGNAYSRMGRIAEAMNDLRNAVRVAQQLENVVEWKIRSRLALGRLSCLTGNLNDTIRDYLDVFRQTLGNDDRERQASVQSALAYVKALQGEGESAIRLIEQAVQIWRQLGEEKRRFSEGLGQAYYTEGVVYRELGQAQKALDYFSLSWDTLVPLGLEEWRSNIRAERGIALWMLDQNDEAETDLEWAVEHGARASVYKAQYYLAQIGWTRGDLEQAEQMFQQCLSDAREYRDALFELQTLGALARLAFYHERASLYDWQEFEQQYNLYRKNYPKARFLMLEGIFFAHLGHLAVKQGSFEKAIESYKLGLRHLATQPDSSRYGRFGLHGQLSFIHRKATRLLSPEKVVILGEELEKTWSQHDLDIAHPEALPFFFRWKQH